MRMKDSGLSYDSGDARMALMHSREGQFRKKQIHLVLRVVTSARQLIA